MADNYCGQSCKVLPVHYTKINLHIYIPVQKIIYQSCWKRHFQTTYGSGSTNTARYYQWKYLAVFSLLAHITTQ